MECLINEKVYHKKYREGVVKAQEGRRIEIQFEENIGSRMFLFPDAFEEYIVLLDEQLQDKYRQYAIEKRKEREREEAARLELKNQMELEEKREKTIQVRKRSSTSLRGKKRTVED